MNFEQLVGNRIKMYYKVFLYTKKKQNTDLLTYVGHIILKLFIQKSAYYR